MDKNQISSNHKLKLEKIGALMKEYRLAEGWTQQMLSEYANLHRNTVIRAENAKNISLLTFLEIADTLNIRLSDIFIND